MVPKFTDSLPDMIITRRSSLSTSVTMFSRSDASMDKDKAFLFLGLFRIILLKQESLTIWMQRFCF